MKTFEISRIIVASDRQRKVFDPALLQEFGDRIATTGLLHPIVCRWAPIIPGQLDKLILVAGERRLRAITDMAELDVQFKHDGVLVPLGHIPYTLLEELDPLAYEEAELEENIRRVDLTWQERAAAHSHLASLRAKQAEAAGLPPPTTADLAEEVRGSRAGDAQDWTRMELIVAKHLDNPEIRAAASPDKAFKILKKQEQTERHRALGVKVGATFSAEMHSLHNGNSLEMLKGLEASTFDCLIADPPYGMNADEFGDSGGLAAGAHGYDDSREYAEKCYVALATEGFRITKPRAHAYIFLDIDSWQLVKAIFDAAGWKVFRTPLIWYKRHGSRAPWPDQGPQRKYETILYAVKGSRPTLRMLGDVLDYPADSNLGHAAQKPVELYRELLSRTCLPGDSAIDPFCGTGPVFPAAHELRVRATGIELDTASYGISVTRVERLKKQGELL